MKKEKMGNKKKDVANKKIIILRIDKFMVY